MSKYLKMAVIPAALFFTACSLTPKSHTYSYKPSYVYDASEEIENAKNNLEDGQKAEVIAPVTTARKVVSLTFDGMTDRETTEKLLALLQEYNMTAVFFLPGIKSAENPETVLAIQSAGKEAGSYPLGEEGKLQDYSREELIENFCRSKNVLEVITGKAPAMIKCPLTDYTDEVLEAVKASGFSYAVESDYYLSYQSFRDFNQVQDYVKNLKRGAVITIKTDGVLEEGEYQEKNGGQTGEEGKEPGEAVPSESMEEDTEKTEKLLTVTEYLLKALKEQEFETVLVSQLTDYADEDFLLDFKDLKDKNKGKKETVFTNAYTTKASLGLIFRGIGEEDTLDSVLAVLKKNNVKATFFVTGYEAIDRENTIKRILAGGHSIENGGFTGTDTADLDFQECCFEIYKAKKIIKEEYGIDTTFYMPANGKVTDTLLEAASALSVTPVTYNKNPVTDTAKAPEEIMAYFKNGFQRGDIIYQNLSAYQKSSQLTKSIVKLAGNGLFSFTVLQDLYLHQYKRTPPDKIPGYGDIKENAVNLEGREIEDMLIDHIPVQTKTVFLTFDDWGSDGTVTKILNILDEYRIKASFFFRANGVELNPNLARAVEEKGHDIGNHSYSHKVITELTIEELKKDTLKGHEIITEAIGRRPQLFYRPPTLEYDEKALRAILSLGYHDIILGDVSTHDYEAGYEEVVRYVKDKATPGSIIVLHMSDNSSAAKALPYIIKELQDKGYDFAKLSDYLQ